jgi:hypothetical protein
MTLCNLVDAYQQPTWTWSIDGLNCCCSSPAQSFLISGPIEISDQIFVLGPSLRLGDGSAFLCRCYFFCRVGVLLVQFRKLLMTLASTVVLGIGPRRDPWQYFCFFQSSVCSKKKDSGVTDWPIAKLLLTLASTVQVPWESWELSELLNSFSVPSSSGQSYLN